MSARLRAVPLVGPEIQVREYLDSLVATDAYSHEIAVSEAHGWDLDALEALPECTEKGRLSILVHELRREDEVRHLRLQRILVSSLNPTGSGVLEDLSLGHHQREIAQKWPSGLESLDQQTGGGIGVTVFAGETGVGKSTLAVSAGLRTATELSKAGWRVVWFNAELDLPTMDLYVRRYLTGLGMDEDEMARRLHHFHHLEVTPAATIEAMAVEALRACGPGTEHLLVVVDTVNTLVKKIQESPGKDAYFHSIRKLGIWAMEARRQSSGDISFLLVSELNKGGTVYGEELDKWADLVVRLRDSDVRGLVEIDVLKGRYSGRPALGLHKLDHQRGVFIPQQGSSEPDSDGGW